jgi:hypothetical protein
MKPMHTHQQLGAFLINHAAASYNHRVHAIFSTFCYHGSMFETGNSQNKEAHPIKFVANLQKMASVRACGKF